MTAGQPPAAWRSFGGKTPAPDNGVGAGLAVALDVQWAGKRATRMAESLWLSVGLTTASCPGAHWELHKMGSWLDPALVAINGSRNMHGVQDGARLVAASGAVLATVAPLDSTVLAVRTRSPVVFPVDAVLEPITGVHFSLFNNAWNTNYPVWAQDSADRFRFLFQLSSALLTGACT